MEPLSFLPPSFPPPSLCLELWRGCDCQFSDSNLQDTIPTTVRGNSVERWNRVHIWIYPNQRLLLQNRSSNSAENSYFHTSKTPPGSPESSPPRLIDFCLSTRYYQQYISLSASNKAVFPHRVVEDTRVCSYKRAGKLAPDLLQKTYSMFTLHWQESFSLTVHSKISKASGKTRVYLCKWPFVLCPVMTFKVWMKFRLIKLLHT